MRKMGLGETPIGNTFLFIVWCLESVKVITVMTVLALNAVEHRKHAHVNTRAHATITTTGLDGHALVHHNWGNVHTYEQDLFSCLAIYWE